MTIRFEKPEVAEIAKLVVRNGVVAAADRRSQSYGHVQSPNSSSRSEIGVEWFLIKPGGYQHPGGDRVMIRFGGPESPLIDGPVAGESATHMWRFGDGESGDWTVMQQVSWQPSAGTERTSTQVLLAIRKRPLMATDPVYGDLLTPNRDGTLNNETTGRPFTLSDADITEILAEANRADSSATTGSGSQTTATDAHSLSTGSGTR